MTVAELLTRANALITVARDSRTRFIAVERGVTYEQARVFGGAGAGDEFDHSRPTMRSMNLVGGSHIYTYRLLRNAIKAAGPDGFVCVLDISHLPIVDPDAVAEDWDTKNVIDEYSFAERQMLAWQSRVHELKANGFIPKHLKGQDT